MILAQLKDYLAERGPVPIAGLARRFEVAPDTMRGMLGYLVRRGFVRPVAGEEICGSCTKCDTNIQEFYAWTNNRKKRGHSTFREKLNIPLSRSPADIRIHST